MLGGTVILNVAGRRDASQLRLPKADDQGHNGKCHRCNSAQSGGETFRALIDREGGE